jgi:transcription initiation factor IIE alpha subunit
MRWFSRKDNSSLSIERLLEELKEKNIVELRKRRLERSGFTRWRIWKLFRISWR